MEGDAESPTIHFDPETDIFRIFGKSTLHNAEAHFRPAIQWLKQHAAQGFAHLTIEFNFEYFNLGTSKMVLEVLYFLDKLAREGRNVTVQWCCPADDDHMCEVGMDLSQLVSLPFSIGTQLPQPELEPAIA